LKSVVVAAAILAGAVGLAAGQQPVKVDVSERAVVAAASKYVVAYEKEVAFLVAEETSEHRVGGRDALGPFRRRLTSELFLTYLPADAEWIAIRDVLEVDGTPTPRQQSVRELLVKADERSVAQQVLKANSRYNLGSIERNFNEPTLPLLLLEPKRVGRVQFDRRAVIRQTDATLVTLSYEEPDQLPLVGGPMGPAPSRGELVIDAATGAVRRTLFTLRKRDIRVRLETVYEFNERLKMWLPATFHEHYERTGDMREVTTVESRYSNYRRYETSWRIGK
jgi:hypothetical protein